MTAPHVTRVEVPTPYTVGPVNLYVVRGDALLLIDTGPITRTGYDLLRTALKRYKATVKDLDAILLTHAHIDHFGMGAILKDRSGARVFGHADDAPFLEGFPDSHLRVIERMGEYSAQHGFPSPLFRRISQAYVGSLSCARAIDVDRTLRGGERLDFGAATLEVVHTPGHTPGSVCYFEPQQRWVFPGDTVLERVTPISFFRGHAAGARLGVGPYLKSLGRIARLSVRRAYPGHRRSYGNWRGAIRQILRHVARHQKAILRALAPGAKSAFEITPQVYPGARAADLWLAFAKTLGILEWLQQSKRVALQDGSADPARFALK